MLAAVYYGPGDIRAEDREVPRVGRQDVLIRPSYVGICGSDVEAFNKGGYAEGTIIGHEFVGIVETVGDGVTSVRESDYVTANAVLPCGVCHACRVGRPSLCDDLVMVGINTDGALAERIRVPAWTVHKLPLNIEPAHGPLIDPLSNVVHAVKISTFEPGDAAAVVGAGPIGLLLTDLLKTSGASKVAAFETNPARLALAGKVGADHLINPAVENPGSMADALTDGKGFGVVFVAAGVGKAAETAYDLVAPGGDIIVIGLIEDMATADYLRMVLSEISVRGSYLGFNEVPVAIDLLSRGVIHAAEIVTKTTHGIRDAVREAIPSLAKPTSTDGKVVIAIGGEI